MPWLPWPFHRSRGPTPKERGARADDAIGYARRVNEEVRRTLEGKPDEPVTALIGGRHRPKEHPRWRR
jgi:hypothetical protein